MRGSRWGRKACHPADEELDDSFGSMTIAVRIGLAGHPLVAGRVVKERTHGLENPLWVCAREGRGAGSNRLRAL